jgi:hypothetical protein
MSQPADPRASLRTRLVLGYGLIGPIVSVATRAWRGAIVLAILALATFLILRPASYRGSAWRATFAVLLLALPLASMASYAFPLFELMEKRRVDLLGTDPWLTLWLAGGFLACMAAALYSAWPRAVARPASDVSAASESVTISRPGPAQFARFGLVLGALVAIGYGAHLTYMVTSMVVSVSLSHVEANVPTEADFDRIMKRDLTAWFTAKDSTVTEVSYELLRKAPTQAGIAPPKYYAWVTIRDPNEVKQGVVRVMALDRVRFEVTSGISSEDILAHPERVKEVYPAGLTGEIERRARAASRQAGAVDPR